MSRRTVPGGWRERRDGSRSWRLPYRDPDTGKQTSRSFATKGDAATFLDELRHGVRTGTYVAPDARRGRFGDFATEWASAQDWSPSTRVAYAASLKRVTVRLGEHRRLDQIDELELAKLRQSLMDAYATSTATITLHYACAVMRAAYRMRRIPRDVTEAIAPPRNRSGRGAGVNAQDVPTRAEVVALMEVAPSNWRAAISLGASGLRVSEVLGVHAEQYDDGVLTVDRQLQRIDGVDSFPLPKREKMRTIHLPDWARDDIERHMSEHQGAGLLFRSRLGAPRRRDIFYSTVWRPALANVGIGERRYKFHSLRHWCASSMLAEGAPLTAVAAHLGDTVETVSRTYVHWLRDEQEVPAIVLSRMLRPRLEVVGEAAT